jgi:WD40 repeat protein
MSNCSPMTPNPSLKRSANVTHHQQTAVAPRTLKLPTSYELCISRSGHLIAAVGRNVVVADMQTRSRLHSSHPLSHPSHADFSANDRQLAIKSTWGEIALLDTQSGEKLTSFRPKRQDQGASILFAPDGDSLVDGAWSGEIRVRQVSDLPTVKSFVFKGEMICAVSRNQFGDLWLFGHTTVTLPEPSMTPRPYLTLWQWPLRSPMTKIDVGLKSLNAAALSLDGSCIAVVGYCDIEKGKVLRLLSTDGAVLASTVVVLGGSGSSTRWSSDSKLVGTVSKGEFRIYSAPDLHLYAAYPEEYPADLAFLSNGNEVVLGSWSAGRIAALPPREA